MLLRSRRSQSGSRGREVHGTNSGVNSVSPWTVRHHKLAANPPGPRPVVRMCAEPASVGSTDCHTRSGLSIKTSSSMWACVQLCSADVPSLDVG